MRWTLKRGGEGEGDVYLSENGHDLTATFGTCTSLYAPSCHCDLETDVDDRDLRLAWVVKPLTPAFSWPCITLCRGHRRPRAI